MRHRVRHGRVSDCIASPESGMAERHDMLHYDSYDDPERIAIKQLSLRGFDPELEKRIRETAKKEGPAEQ
jgi:hypothetical protein